MDATKIKLVAFDLDGTLTQHKTPLSEEHKQVLDALGKKYKLLMAGAGMCHRIFDQMNQYPIDILGNYGLQYAEYNHETKDIEIKRNEVLPCDRESVEKRVTYLREKYTPQTVWAISEGKRHLNMAWLVFIGWVISYVNEWEDYSNYFWEEVEISRIWATTHSLVF